MSNGVVVALTGPAFPTSCETCSPWSTFSSQPARGSLINSAPGWRRSIAATALSSRAVLAQPCGAFDPCMASRRNDGEMTTTLDRQNRRRSPLASGSVREHLLRGAAGLTTAALAIVLLAVVGPVSLVLLPVTAAAWRGCPTCWTVGLLGTLADERDRRGCSRC